MNPTVRFATLIIPDGQIDEAAEAMRKAEQELKGILALKGLRAFFAGVDRVQSLLTNVSLWDSPKDAEQLSSFQPMLDLAKRWPSAKGAGGS